MDSGSEVFHAACPAVVFFPVRMLFFVPPFGVFRLADLRFDA
jgi:hypothetical protein